MLWFDYADVAVLCFGLTALWLLDHLSGLAVATINHPDIEPVDDDRYRLDEEWRYVTQAPFYLSSLMAKVHFTLLIHRGFLYDGASVPAAATVFTGIKTDGLYRAAALVHDLLYRINGDFTATQGLAALTLRSNHGPPVFTRKEADRLFRRILRESGVGAVRAFLAYHAVRNFGRGHPLKRNW